MQHRCCLEDLCSDLSECGVRCTSYVVSAEVSAPKVVASVSDCGFDAGDWPGITVKIGGTFAYTGTCNSGTYISGTGNTKWNQVSYAAFLPTSYQTAEYSIDDCSGMDCYSIPTSGSFTPTSSSAHVGSGDRFVNGGLLLVRERILDGTGTTYDPADVTGTRYYWMFGLKVFGTISSTTYSLALAIRTDASTSCPEVSPPDDSASWEARLFSNDPLTSSEPNYDSDEPDLYFWNRQASFLEIVQQGFGGGTLRNRMGACASSDPTVSVSIS
jgi:hypothetical protein